MNTHDVRFVWLKVQSDMEWNSHWNILAYRDYFWTAKWDFPEKEGKGQQEGTNLNLKDGEEGGDAHEYCQLGELYGLLGKQNISSTDY